VVKMARKNLEIQIFEVKGTNLNSELSTDLDILILNLHKRYPAINFKKINVLDKESMKKHKDILRILNKRGLEALPLIKFNGKILSEQELEPAIKRILR